MPLSGQYRDLHLNQEILQRCFVTANPDQHVDNKPYAIKAHHEAPRTDLLSSDTHTYFVHGITDPITHFLTVINQGPHCLYPTPLGSRKSRKKGDNFSLPQCIGSTWKVPGQTVRADVCFEQGDREGEERRRMLEIIVDGLGRGLDG